MPEPVKISDLPIEEHPAETAWKKYETDGKSGERPPAIVFFDGWKACLAWFPFRIQQFREMEEALRKEIEDLKNQNTSS